MGEERFGGSVRFHALDDGPKFVCYVDYIAKKGKKEGCLVYSVLGATMIFFHLNKMSIQLWGARFTRSILPLPMTRLLVMSHDIATFHEWGLGKDNSVNPSYKSTGTVTVIKELGHTGRTIDIFKIDIDIFKIDC